MSSAQQIPTVLSARFAAAREAFASIDREDPRVVSQAGAATTKCAAYHQLVARFVERLDPHADEAVRLAARCQHIRRFAIPRSDYPADGAGYKRWRADLARFHAQEAAVVLRQVGYEDDVVARVGELVQKRRLKSDPQVQLLEDAICLAFIAGELAEFARSKPHAKMIDIVQKTWAKMSERGQRAALDLLDTLPTDIQQLLRDALSRPA